MIHGIEGGLVKVDWYFPIGFSFVDMGFFWALLVVPYDVDLFD